MITHAKVREFCLSLPDSSEKPHFGDSMFYVLGKGFASCGEKHGPCQIVVGLEPAHAAMLVERDSRFTAYPRAKHAVVLELARAKNWAEVKGLLLASYEMVKAQAQKKKAPARGRKRASPR